jgi:hypothetical protein
MYPSEQDNEIIMHFNEFLQLNETEQVELLWYNGEQIGRRKEDDYLILLYQVEGFYVEVFYHRKQRVIKHYMSFDCGDSRLEPYLDKIDITPVYKQIRKQSRNSDLGLVDYFVSMATDKSIERNQMPQKQEQHPQTSFWKRLQQLFRRSSK